MIEMEYGESSTEYIRRVLAAIEGEFYAADLFGNIDNSSAIMHKFMMRGEIEFVRWQPNGGKPYKIYRVVKLKVFKQRGMHSAKQKPRKHNVVPMHPVAQNWKDAFPDMFCIPEFKIIGRTVHKEDME